MNADAYLLGIYRRAAEKVLIEKGTQQRACELMEEIKALKKARQRIRKASQIVTTALSALPRKQCDFETLEDTLGMLLRGVLRRVEAEDEQLRQLADALWNVQGHKIALSSSAPTSLLYRVRPKQMSELALRVTDGDELLESYVTGLTGGRGTPELFYRFPTRKKRNHFRSLVRFGRRRHLAPCSSRQTPTFQSRQDRTNGV